VLRKARKSQLHKEKKERATKVPTDAMRTDVLCTAIKCGEALNEVMNLNFAAWMDPQCEGRQQVARVCKVFKINLIGTLPTPGLHPTMQCLCLIC
jgi:hypothetical protein